LNHWGVVGDWIIGARSVVLNQPGGAISYRFHARDVNLVMAAPGGQPWLCWGAAPYARRTARRPRAAPRP
ncbi:hypothetical protein AB0E57_11200, partial [Micrococcus luteus]